MNSIIERREFKYLVPPRRLAAIRAHVRQVCQRDAHGGPDGRYRIRSLYLDTPDMRLFDANEREAPERFKARVRCYPDAMDHSPVFFEIKRRTLDVIRKSRFGVAPERVHAFLQPFPYDQTDDPAGERFLALLRTYGLSPRVQVQYQREAWVSQLDDYARISIDTHIACQEEARWTLQADEHRWRSVDNALITITREPVAVLELKFADQAPSWMVSLVRRFDLMRHSFSKYCTSVTEQLAWASMRPRCASVNRAGRR